MKSLFVLAVIVMVVYGIIRSAKQRSAAMAAWEATARAHGLTYEAGGAFSHPALRGIHEGYRVTIDVLVRNSGKHSTTHTRYRVHYAKLGNGIRLTREVPVLSTIGKLFGGEDHETGDPDFDDKVIVRAPDEARARDYLTAPRRRAIEKFLSSHKHAVITESNATFETPGLETRQNALERGLRLLVELARELEPDADGKPSPTRLPSSRRGAAAGVAAALGALTAVQVGDDEEDWTLPPAPRPEPEVAPPTRQQPPQPKPEIAAPAPARAPVTQHEAPEETAREPAAERIAIGCAPPMPDIPSIDPDAPASATTEETAMASARQQDVCEALFAEGGGLSGAKDRFEADYANLFVHWSGELRSARHYYSDMVFGSAAGTRAEVVVAKVASGILGEREIIAVVQLPDGVDAELAPRVGSALTFEGDLASVDPFMRQVFVRNARVVS